MSATSMATARLMETWAHGRDVATGLGFELPADDRVRHVVHLGVRTRDFAYANRGLEPPQHEFRLELRLPGGAVLTYGPDDAAQSVSGAAYDFALVVTQRLPACQADLVAVGPDARRWLDLAQAFAGPPGRGAAVEPADRGSDEAVAGPDPLRRPVLERRAGRAPGVGPRVRGD